MKKKIMSVFGTRPEAIKMAPLIRAMQADPEIEPIVCLSGQHRSMLDQVLTAFGISAHFDLALMTGNQTLNGVASKVIASLDHVIAQVRPDRIVVHGDTTTASAAAIAAFNSRVPVAHVEAGLRTRDLQHPWPEEANRRVVDVVADLLFAPTRQSKSNLAAETLAGKVYVTGNTVIDALHSMVRRIEHNPPFCTSLDSRFRFINPMKHLVLVTGHRRENFGAGLANVCAALADIARRDDVQIVYPVHLNPNVLGPVRDALNGVRNVHLIEPQDYAGFIRLLQCATLVLTDSGGVQEEAPALGKPVLVMRDTTERPEAIEAGTVQLVGTRRDTIVGAVTYLLDDPDARAAFARRVNPYGDGRASQRIVAALAGRAFEEFAPPADVAPLAALA
ncbi:UDP-N-acetylglucosamine 2-epimerase (non-hydrolyzing) [Burkholderia sp. Ac-20365]|uniref:non-hydrolyzing UDP-N-acetylglucosamine 2-epimerase n=1 Tax=Burkholderia sp. Ac-20365 TaxID=2703897 RepID=UPI00197B2FB8|nr:UDP-N-acetylglucosamine 2-epimerase (non-hydrolyzing) [Burkholderia sp. Ac-20365]MBN3761856.1 UDP-N-acetylglucosamine 2-epimerase (non-hydrolyzing) [Burkholderia sp. Ac-20365]